MILRQFLRATLCALLTLSVVASLAPLAAAASAPIAKPKRLPDLADFVAGEYFGSVISDSRGSSQNGVTLYVTRIGKNRVQITSDYPRLPVADVSIRTAMRSIVQANGNTVFVIDRAKDSRRLDISFNNEVTWSGNKR